MSIAPLPSRGDLARLLLAHPLVGGGIALLLRSGLGSAPWDVFHFGLHRATGLSVGAATNLTALAAILVALAAGVRPGPATAANALLLGLCVDAAYAPLPLAAGFAVGLGYQALGMVLIGLGTGLYMSADLGNGPRDSLMVALSRRAGWPLVAARTGLEASALAVGWLLGGPVGVGTVLFAVGAGPVTQWGINLFARDA
jgi:uncharacterized membrane protein YczE